MGPGWQREKKESSRGKPRIKLPYATALHKLVCLVPQCGGVLASI